MPATFILARRAMLRWHALLERRCSVVVVSMEQKKKFKTKTKAEMSHERERESSFSQSFHLQKSFFLIHKHTQQLLRTNTTANAIHQREISFNKNVFLSFVALSDFGDKTLLMIVKVDAR